MKIMSSAELALTVGAGEWLTEKCHGYETDGGTCIGIYVDKK